jgi:hypothetical protein
MGAIYLTTQEIKQAGQRMDPFLSSWIVDSVRVGEGQGVEVQLLKMDEHLVKTWSLIWKDYGNAELAADTKK